MKLTAVDLSFNIAALTIAICHERYMLPEEAFAIIEGTVRYTPSKTDKEDMINLHNQGISFNKLGKIYGCTGSNVYKNLMRYQAKKETSLAVTRKGQE